MRIDYRLRTRQLAADLVVVRYNKLHTQIIDMICLLNCAYAVINSDDKIYTVCGNFIYGAVIKSVALGFPAWYVIANISTLIS